MAMRSAVNGAAAVGRRARGARRRLFLPACLLLAALLGQAAPARAAVIDFENVQAPVTVIAQFNHLGVSFNGPLLRDFSSTPGFAHSGNNAIQLCPAQPEFCSTPLRIRFTAGQTRVKLWVGVLFGSPQPAVVLLQAFDLSNAQVAQSSVVIPASSGPIAVSLPLEVIANGPTIRTVVVQFEQPPGGGGSNSGLVVDDLEFDTAGAPPLCGAATGPGFDLTQPSASHSPTVNANRFVLAGAVATETPLEEARLTVSGTNGTRTTDVLGTLVSASGGPFATQIGDALTTGANQISLFVRNCRAGFELGATVVYAPIQPGTQVRLLGMEIIQATQDIANSVPLVGGKPTIVRAYFRVEGPGANIHQLSAAMTATRPGGTLMQPGGTLLTPLLHSINAVSAGPSDLAPLRSSLVYSVNFVLPPDWYRSGTVHFQISKLFVQGQEVSLPCIGCDNFDAFNARRWTQFLPTRPLNIVLAPHRYRLAEETQTPDLLISPIIALEWLNNALPLAGNFPVDGTGVNLLRVLPMRDTDLNLAGAPGSQGGIFLVQLETLRNELREENDGVWPDDVHLIATTPFGIGGRTTLGGRAAYVSVANEESGLASEDDYSSLGRIWAHEVGHTFGRQHAVDDPAEASADLFSDPNFPFTHAGIGEPGVAIRTEWWASVPPRMPGVGRLFEPGTPAAGLPHAHDLMSSVYDSVWISPYTYRALFNALRDFPQARAQAAAAAPARIEKLAVSGLIGADGSATLLPFRRVRTRFGSGSGDTGAFSIDLLDGAGRVLASHRFNPYAIEDSAELGISEFVPWRPGTRRIVLRGRAGILATRDVTPHAPWVRITSPRGGERWTGRARISWEAGDADGDPLTFTLFYRARPGEAWLPLATDLRGRAATIDTRLLPGSGEGRIRVRASDGVNSTETESPRPFIVPRKPPLVAILRPRGDTVIPAEQPIELIGAAYDAEDGLLADPSLCWSSDRDGRLGCGRRLAMRSLSPGPHRIELTAVDGQRQSAIGYAAIVIASGPPPQPR